MIQTADRSPNKFEAPALPYELTLLLNEGIINLEGCLGFEPTPQMLNHRAIMLLLKIFILAIPTFTHTLSSTKN